MHAVDFVEEIAVSYGFQNFAPKIPKVATIGRESPWQILKRRIANLFVGIGAYEVMTYMLTNEENNFTKMGVPVSDNDLVQIENPLTSLTTICRNWLTP